MSEPPTNKNCSLTASIIDAEDNRNLAVKITITQEEVSVDYSTTHVEEALSETPKASEILSTKDMPQKRTATVMDSSKNRNYHICKITYNLYEDNIFQNKK